MARVNGPLFSMEATGKMGELVFATWRGINTVRRLVVPSNPNTQGQVAVRAMFKFLSKAWGQLSQAEQDSWSAAAASDNLPYFNAFMRNNQQKFVDAVSAFISKDPADTPGTLTDASNVQYSENGNITTVTAEISAGTAENWGIAFLKVPSGAAAPTAMLKSNVVKVVEATADATYTLEHDNEGVATDYYAVTFGRNGSFGTVVAAA